MICNKNISKFNTFLMLFMLPLLFACGPVDQTKTKSYLEANPPAWVPSGSTLLYGVDGSIWVNCIWRDGLYHCAFYEVYRDEKVEQSYQLCSIDQSAALIDGQAYADNKRYYANGLFFLPATPPVYYEGGKRQPSPKSNEEFVSLDIEECSQRFLPVK